MFYLSGLILGMEILLFIDIQLAEIKMGYYICMKFKRIKICRLK